MIKSINVSAEVNSDAYLGPQAQQQLAAPALLGINQFGTRQFEMRPFGSRQLTRAQSAYRPLKQRAAASQHSTADTTRLSSIKAGA